MDASQQDDAGRQDRIFGYAADGYHPALGKRVEVAPQRPQRAPDIASHTIGDDMSRHAESERDEKGRKKPSANDASGGDEKVVRIGPVPNGSIDGFGDDAELAPPCGIAFVDIDDGAAQSRSKQIKQTLFTVVKVVPHRNRYGAGHEQCGDEVRFRCH